MPDRTGIDAPATIVFTLFYGLFCTGFVYQSKEFSGAGISPENFLSYRGWMGSEEIRFVYYHLKRTAGTMIIHSFLPFVYLIGYSYFTSVIDGNHASMTEFWQHWPVFYNTLLASVMLPLSLITLVWYWSLDGWKRHPFVKRLSAYATNNTSWQQVAANIETEFRRIDKITIRTNPMVKVVVTDNWLVLVTASPWSMNVSHQSDISLQLAKAEHHQISQEMQVGGTQFLSIEVKSRKPNVPPYYFRLNSTEFQNLQDKVKVSIQNFRNIHIYKTVTERFVDAFKEEIEKNPVTRVTDELESCIGCMAVTANVSLQRLCESSQNQERAETACVVCYCRPMWCVDCMAKWFASRQDQSNPENWLAQKCPCPTCRNKFCVRDVCLIQQ
jgi:hypothetical protein